MSSCELVFKLKTRQNKRDNMDCMWMTLELPLKLPFLFCLLLFLT